MAIVCRDLRLLFIMVPGTGCSALGKVLLSEFGGQYLPARDIVRGGRTVHPRKHNTVAQLLRDRLISREELESWLVVATVRNPFDRLVTYYQRLSRDWIDRSLGVRERQIERERQEMSRAEYQDRVKIHEWAKRVQKRRQRMVRRIGFNPWLLGTIFRWFARDISTPPCFRVNRLEMMFPMLDDVDLAIRSEVLQQGVRTLLGSVGGHRTVEIPRKNATPGKQHYSQYYSRLSQWIVSSLYRQQLADFGYSFEGFEGGPSSALICLSLVAEERMNPPRAQSIQPAEFPRPQNSG